MPTIAQGGTPIVDGPIKASGVPTTESASGLPLYTSHGTATQHDAFTNAAFDVAISFDLRLVAAQALSIDVASVTDAQMAAFWGSTWNQPAAWVTLSGSVGQEVFNPYADRQAYVGGSFSSFYIGPSV